MDKSVPGKPAFLAPPPAGPADDGRGRVRVVRTLREPGRDLDANVVRMDAGAVLDELTAVLTEAVLGVLLVVVSGSGEFRTPDRTVTLAPGSVAWLPAGTAYRVRAGDDGLTYTTAHRRPPHLETAPQPVSDAGEPACLLHLVCEACGRLAAERDARYCTRCGALLADGNPVAG
ncbi:AraC family ligand binding domain-containing protein [Streptomyces kutzneri]|uniref:AraC family ligand binding domain-containing protein n=1 Tax=Streptomyces kutzneri TaxID=3051179 RepID=UPI0028D21BE3|nr:AraC family ligand binding domain-containing protein [Streptomyces sp. DSM 40907]